MLDRDMVNRLTRATGHLKMVKQMVEDGRGCSEVLIQLAAVKSAVNGAGKEVLKQYAENPAKQNSFSVKNQMRVDKSFSYLL